MIIEFILLFIVFIFALLAIVSGDLTASIFFLSGFSFLMAVIWKWLGAVDVSFTEAAVGAGVSTVFLLAVLLKTEKNEKFFKGFNLRAFILTLIPLVLLLYSTRYMPEFMNPENITNHHVIQRYIEKTIPETHVPNMVTSILASYRGYDTLGETTVIFLAGICVVFLLRKL